MKKLAALTLTAGLLAAPAFATKVSFSLDIEALVQGDGTTTISDSGLLVLVVDTAEDGFDLPGDGSFVSDDDQVVATWDLNDHSFDSPDITLLTPGGVPYGEDWDEGDRLALFWFPTLGAGDAPGADTAYGVFADAIGIASGDAWQMPASGTLLHSLKLFTEAATKLVMFGDYPTAAGATAFAVNNPPSTGTPAEPSVAITLDGTQNLVSWTSDTEPALGFIVQRKLVGGDWETIGFADGSATSFNDTTIKPGREYQYQLLSTDTFAASESNTPTVTAERSVFQAIASRASVVADPPDNFQSWGLINAGVRITGNDPFKKVMVLGLGPHFNNQLNTTAWVDDPTLSYNILGDPEPIAENNDWMVDFNNPGNQDPDAEAALITMEKVGSPVLEMDTLDSSILEDVPIDTNNLFKVRTNGTGGFVGIQLYNAEFEGEDGPTIHDNRFISISSRGYLADGGVFNGTVSIRGNVPKEVLAVARSAGALEGVPLEDPFISFRALGVGEIATNDDWNNQTATVDPDNGLLAMETNMDRLESVMAASNVNVAGLTKDSAMLVTLEPGDYNFRVLAADGSKGDGSVIIEVIEVELD